MSGIAGLIRWHPDRVDPDAWSCMTNALTYWGRDGHHTHTQDHASFAYFHMASTPEDAFTQQPTTLDNGELFVAAARLDNRDELCDALHIDHAQRATLADSTLVGQAYLKWGSESINHLRGDWSFAAWNPTTRRVFLARDPLGQTALYYVANHNYFAFASGMKALLALDPALHQIDDLYIAQVLLAWPVYHGPQTVYPAIRRLPPAHTLTITQHADQPQSHQYWFAEEITIPPPRARNEAVEGFLHHYQQAVNSRLRANGRIGVTLSGGLDSGSVTALAASTLAQRDTSLTAYTSVPIHPTASVSDTRFGNEWEMAAATAAYYGITDHQPLPADHISPLEGITASLQVHDEPQHAASNAFWITALLQKARADGIKVLLTGQGGNATVSWFGPKKATHATFGQRVGQILRSVFPPTLATQLRVWKQNYQAHWRTMSVVNPDLVRRTRALAISARDPHHPMHTYNATALPARFAIIKPGRTMLGALWHQSSAAYGLDVRDPTLDQRLVEYCLAIPDAFYRDDTTGYDRAIIRQAMQNRLPDAVRLNRSRGLQAADTPHRLRQEAAAVEATIDSLAHGIAAEYLNIANLRHAWRYAQQHNDRIAFREATIVLLRGIMAGRFVQDAQFPRPAPLPTLDPTSPEHVR